MVTLDLRIEWERGRSGQGMHAPRLRMRARNIVIVSLAILALRSTEARADCGILGALLSGGLCNAAEAVVHVVQDPSPAHIADAARAAIVPMGPGAIGLAVAKEANKAIEAAPAVQQALDGKEIQICVRDCDLPKPGEPAKPKPPAPEVPKDLDPTRNQPAPSGGSTGEALPPAQAQ